MDQPIDYVWKTNLELSDCELDGVKLNGVKVLILSDERGDHCDTRFTKEDVIKMAEVLGMVVS